MKKDMQLKETIMKNLIVIMLLIVNSSFQYYKHSVCNYDNLCKILSDKKVLSYLHFEIHSQIDTIRIIDNDNFLVSRKDAFLCNEKKIVKVKNSINIKRPLELELFKVESSSHGLQLLLKYDFEGLIIKAELPKDKNKGIFIEINEQ
jgi:hypothetical protein